MNLIPLILTLAISVLIIFHDNLLRYISKKVYVSILLLPVGGFLLFTGMQVGFITYMRDLFVILLNVFIITTLIITKERSIYVAAVILFVSSFTLYIFRYDDLAEQIGVLLFIVICIYIVKKALHGKILD